MKRLSKMAYELRDVTIFFDKHVNQYSTRFIATTHNRSTSRICQILIKQKVRYGFYVKQITDLHEQIFAKSIIKRYLVEQFYHYEIGLILQRYYIKMKNVRH